MAETSDSGHPGCAKAGFYLGPHFCYFSAKMIKTVKTGLKTGTKPQKLSKLSFRDCSEGPK